MVFPPIYLLPRVEHSDVSVCTNRKRQFAVCLASLCPHYGSKQVDLPDSFSDWHPLNRNCTCCVGYSKSSVHRCRSSCAWPGQAIRTSTSFLRSRPTNCTRTQGHGACQGIASLGDIHPVPLPYVRVEVNGKTMEFDTLKLNPSSALSEGSGGAAKVFNRYVGALPWCPLPLT